MSISCTDLVVTRGEHRVIDGLSFSVSNGELLWLKGPNGCGKSTVLLAISGRAASEGVVHLDGADARAMLPWVREERMPFLAQEPELQTECLAIDNLVDTLTLGDHAWRWLTMPASRARAKAWDAVGPLAARLGMDRIVLWQPLAQLSVGQRRLCGLLRVLRPRSDGRPRVLLLDEPLSGLRGDKVEAVLALVQERLSAGWSAVVSEHVEAIAQVPELRVLEMRGRG